MYIEAFKESHVMEAIRGLRNVLISKGAKLVPLREMVEAITVNTKAKKAIGIQQSFSLHFGSHESAITRDKAAVWMWLVPIRQPALCTVPFKHLMIGS